MEFFEMKSTGLRVLKHFAFWITILSLFTILPGLPDLENEKYIMHLKINLIYFPLDIITTYILLYRVLTPFILNAKKLPFILGIIGLYVLTIIASYFIDIYGSKLIGFELRATLSQRIYQSIIIITTIFGFASAFKLMSLWSEIKIKKLDDGYQNELHHLKSQINPHFLFNTLNNIDELVFEDHQKASDAIHKLSGIMRYMLSQNESEKRQLVNELKFISNYIELAKQSLPSDDFIQFNIKGNPKRKVIEPFIFLSIIENAIKHSSKEVPSPGIIFDFTFDTDTISLKSLNYKQKAVNTKESTKVGLENLQRRLDLLYTSKYDLNIEDSDDKYTLTLSLRLS